MSLDIPTLPFHLFSNSLTMKQYILPIVSSIIVWATVYGFSYESDPSVLLEKQNRKSVMECINNLNNFTWSTLELQKEAEKCAKIQLQSITWTSSGATRGSAPWYTSQHSLDLSWSHDYRIYAKDNPGVAMWKNNNPSGTTWHASSDILKRLWTDNGIHHEIWSLRPPNEWWNYVLFSSIEDGLRAKVTTIRERWKKASVAHFLNVWGTWYLELSFDKSKKIWELTDAEFQELFIKQMQKESPWLVSQLVKDWILVIK